MEVETAPFTLPRYFIKGKKDVFFLRCCVTISAMRTKAGLEKYRDARLIACAKRDASALIRTLKNMAIKKSRKILSRDAVRENGQWECARV